MATKPGSTSTNGTTVGNATLPVKLTTQREMAAAAQRAVEVAAQSPPVQVAFTTMAQQEAVTAGTVAKTVHLSEQAITELAQSDDYLTTVQRVFADTLGPDTTALITQLRTIRNHAVLDAVATASLGLTAVAGQVNALATSGQPAVIQHGATPRSEGGAQ